MNTKVQTKNQIIMKISKKLLTVEIEDETGYGFVTELLIESGNKLRTKFFTMSTMLNYCNKCGYEVAISDILLV